MARHVFRSVTAENLHKIGSLRPRAYHAHVALEDIYELRKFIQTSSPEIPPNAGDLILLGCSPLGVAHMAANGFHSPEFVNPELSAVQANPLLAKNNRTGRTDPYSQRDQ